MTTTLTRPPDTNAPTAVVVPGVPAEAERGWRRLVTSVDRAQKGAFALGGLFLTPGAAYEMPRGVLADALDFDEHPEYAGFDILYDHSAERDLLDYRIIGAIAPLLPERFLLRKTDGSEYTVLGPPDTTPEEMAQYAAIADAGYDVELGRRIGISDMIREAILDAKGADSV